MRLESKKYLHDALQAGRNATVFCKGRSLAEYRSDLLLRSATERQFEIIGEALRRLSSEDPATAMRISEYQRVIAFRNILIHGYAEIDDRIVWDVLRNKLPRLLEELEALLDET